MVEPQVIVRNMLRTRLTDPQTSRPAGDQYISSDWPRFTDLTFNNFPRISVIKPDEGGDLFGIGSTVLYDVYRLQITVWVKEEQPLVIGGTSYEGKALTIKIMRDLETAIKQNWISDIANPNGYVVYKKGGMSAPEIDYDKKYWKQDLDITFEAVRM